MNKDSKIMVLGKNGLVGSAIIRALKIKGFTNILGVARKDYDLLNPSKVNELMTMHRPEYVFDAAAKVGGINANNKQSADFIRDNLLIQNNVIDACHKFEVKKLMFLGSSCIYPKDCPQPIKEEYFLSGELEQTNIGYAIAKIAGLIMCKMYRKQYGCNFISVMPTNLYGQGDNFNLVDSHVLPAMIRKFHEAKISNAPTVEMWGTGTAKREFLFIDDLAEALIFLMDNYNEVEHINIGTGQDVTIKELAETVKKIVGFEGELVWNTSYPDGTMRKQLDVSKINSLGWKSTTSLEAGIKLTYDWFIKNYNTARL
jgi:GDP-L-fucose synthase